MRNIIGLLLVVIICTAFSLLRTAEGTVKDAQGKAVAGAVVQVKGGKAATTTDAGGRFALLVPDGNIQLVISSVGYLSQEVRWAEKPLQVVLHPAGTALDEVVVTGYTASRKREVTGALQGQAAGITIRGNGTLHHKEADTEEYSSVTENIFHTARARPLSTFSIDVDRASYSNLRRFLNRGQLPPAGSVRVEEMINYFRYAAPQPSAGRPFSVQSELGPCPWNEGHRLARITLKGKEIATENLPPAHMIFLVDVSGSMNDPQKLPLVKESLRLLTGRLRPQDKVSIVVYAGAAGLVLPPTSGEQKETILSALDRLEAGGSTAGGEGIRLAYETARAHFIPGGNNRVVLCTDGDFNVGVSSEAELKRLVEGERKSGVYLTVLGYGMGNYKDNKMQELAQNGNGNHAYIDDLTEARRLLGTAFGGTLFTIAQDVKLQVEFNPSVVAGYRLIGYENRLLNDEDFEDDAKDAGEMGSGHTVTALYEIIPVGVASPFLKGSRPMRYSHRGPTGAGREEVLTVSVRYKAPGAARSEEAAFPLANQTLPYDELSPDYKLASAVAEFGLLLTGSPFKGNASYDRLLALGRQWSAPDPEGERTEFFALVEKARKLVIRD